MEPVWWTKCSFLILSMIILDQDIGRTLSGKLSGSDGEHIDPTTETSGNEQDVAVASRRDRKRAEVVDTDGDTRTLRETHEMTGQRTVSRGFFRAWRFKQCRSHYRVQTIIPSHQQNRSSMRKVRVVPRWQETV